MPNSYFQFKQFTIHQERCAMKVCTDSCLFGAWIDPGNASLILDIGTGTGLLALMLAQRTATHIAAIEIDEDAFLQAQENFDASPWKTNISLHHADARDLNLDFKYDLIVCNPPFYETDMHSSHEGEKMAKHSTHLTLRELIEAIISNFKTDGRFAVLLPWKRREEFDALCLEKGFFPSRQLFIRQTPAHGFFRYAAEFCRNSADAISFELSIRTSDGSYSPEAISLLKPYYLYL